MECPDLRKAHAYLSQGTRPSTKNTKSTLVKRCLQNIISNDGLLVRRETTPFLPTRKLIVVPQQLIKGLLTSIHIQFDHPPASQLLKLFSRNFYPVKAQENITNITNACSTSQLLYLIRTQYMQSIFYADIKNSSLFCETLFHHIQQLNLYRMSDMTLSEAITIGISHFCPSNQTPVIIRVHSASGIYALRDDLMLKHLNISLVELNTQIKIQWRKNVYAN